MLASWILTAAFAVLFVRSHWRLVLVARASHELRGPLSAVQLGIAALSGEPTRVAAIELELQRAGRALEDLAAAPSGRRADASARRVDLAQLAAEHEPAWRALAGAFGAELRVEAEEAVVVADPLRIAQACSNLVGNAAEHGGGLIRLDVRVSGEQVRLEVADDGPGLPASVAVLTATARTRRGPRGHGLAIVAAIAEQHGGRLTAAPASHGARLVLELPNLNGPGPFRLAR